MIRSGIVLADHRQRIRTLQLRYRGPHGLEEILHRLQVMVDAMRDDFGIGLGAELIPGAFQLGTQFLVILDDAVVDDGQTVAGNVRMCVALARHSMRGPAGVGNSQVAVQGRAIQRLLQHLHLPLGTDACQMMGAVEHGKAGRVIPPVFQAS